MQFAEFLITKNSWKKVWFSRLSIIRSIIEEYKVDLIIDVGANKGQFAFEVRRFYKGLIMSFEPVLATFNVLKQNASDDKNWYVFNYALGSESKQLYMNVYERDEFSSILETNEPTC